jgi:hypothetical protein
MVIYYCFVLIVIFQPITQRIAKNKKATSSAGEDERKA